MRRGSWPVVVAATVAVVTAGLLAQRAETAEAREPVPVLAYYYIWFNATSWDRAKTDFPALGRYSSDEARVMRRHIQLAKEAGIGGFLVSWKSTPGLNRRLEKLLAVANEEDFPLGIVYQALDFDRDPLEEGQIARDLEVFVERFADDPAFDLFGKPIVIWTGTWKFSRDTINRVVDAVGDDLRILASEPDVEGYERLSDLVEGNAYYWSSVDPESYENYWQKLVELSDVVHAAGGLWIAPVAPGFDARLVGGTTVVPRRNGATLRERFDGAVRSSPDAIGAISWNEFSENTHIEPSTNYGSQYLEIMADITGAQFRSSGEFDSAGPPSEPRSATDLGYAAPLLGGVIALGVLAFATAIWRNRRTQGTTGPNRTRSSKGAPDQR